MLQSETPCVCPVGGHSCCPHDFLGSSILRPQLHCNHIVRVFRVPLNHRHQHRPAPNADSSAACQGPNTQGGDDGSEGGGIRPVLYRQAGWITAAEYSSASSLSWMDRGRTVIMVMMPDDLIAKGWCFSDLSSLNKYKSNDMEKKRTHFNRNK